ncbi:protein-L-isoaspartate O-methyltransferase domain-containing protein 1-like isoform X2 [Gordionus sp. m RMFG-2023]|uniref:protein-L-isoaspartate O-methyltransferase domain-containing protein 1-like isoform X2 n=1 Tax=Gordionus sp. m RMFG-2023 TaxID=3053472 RepID=UPI0031FCB8E0
MGGAVSAGKNNDELIDNLVKAKFIRNFNIEEAFRIVDRSYFFPKDFVNNAYMDMAWKHGDIHISAPCIYSEIIEALNIQHKMSFLNIGSGTGYLSTIAGILLGPFGVNHGVEIFKDLIEFSQFNIENFKRDILNYRPNAHYLTSTNDLIYYSGSSKKRRSTLCYNHSFSCLPIKTFINHDLFHSGHDSSNSDNTTDNHENTTKFPVISCEDFCQPTFIHGNVIDILISSFIPDFTLNYRDDNGDLKAKYNHDTRDKTKLMKEYDRIYCGATCLLNMEELLKRLIKVGGILVLPSRDQRESTLTIHAGMQFRNNQLICINRTAVDEWKSDIIMPVCFAPLILPEVFQELMENFGPSFIPQCINEYITGSTKNERKGNKNKDVLSQSYIYINPMPLKEICRYFVRKLLHEDYHSKTQHSILHLPQVAHPCAFTPKDMVQSSLDEKASICDSTSNRILNFHTHINKSKRSYSIQIVDFPRMMEFNINDHDIAESKQILAKKRNEKELTMTLKRIEQRNRYIDNATLNLPVPQVLRQYLSYI